MKEDLHKMKNNKIKIGLITKHVNAENVKLKTNINVTTNDINDLTSNETYAKIIDCITEEINNMRNKDEIEKIKEIIDEWSDEERIELFSNYCHYCGSLDPRCHCSNEE